ncbi:hypothetical protein AGMMS50293_26710 [Spirochaetia bacterium]|nr:hypothetical protein AGMMS50293_26710 [Spirochaetia bacterium]
MAAIEKDGRQLKYVPEDLKTAKNADDIPLWLAAVRQNSFALEFVSNDLKTPELCLEAVRKDGYATTLQYVDKNLQTSEILRSAIMGADGWRAGYVLSLAAETLKTPELCRLAAQKSGGALASIPDALRTAEICRLAVQDEGFYLKDVPEELRTPELCRLAVEKNGDAIIYVPNDLLTPELCLAAVQQSRLAIRKIPPYLRSAEVWHTARTVTGSGVYSNSKFNHEL